MKKIAFIIRMFQEKTFHGGGEKLFANLIKYFSGKNFLIDVYCSESNVSKTKNINRIEIIKEPYDHNKPETMESFYSAVKERIKEEGYDFVISENITPPVDITFLQGHSLVNRLKKTKNIFEKFLYKFRNTKKQRIKYQKKWINQGYRRIFTVSEILKQDIVENFGISEDKISVIYPGVDISESKEEIKLNKPVIFGLIAPGFRIKGGFVFLKALKLLKEQGYGFKAKIIYPKHRKNLGVNFLIKIYNLSQNIEFLDYQENIFSFYKSVDCLVVPSWEDTFNLSVLEAMSCSRPCIVSKNAGASEIIERGINGFTFDINNSGAKNLAEKMEFLIKNPDLHTAMSLSAFETAKKYNWEDTCKKVLEELKII